MKPLPNGYRHVAIVSMAYASIVLLYYGSMAKLLLESPGPWFKNKSEFVFAMLLVSAPLALFFGNALIFSQQLKWLRIASITLLAAGVLLLAKSIVATWAILDLMHSDPSGFIMVCAIPIVVVPSGVFGITALVTGTLLYRRLHPPD